MANILFVDDDPDFIAAVRPLLRNEGHTVEVAGSCEDARTLLDRQRFDLLFADLLLPDGSGIQLASDDGPRTIIITGHPSVESAVRAVRGPVVDYIVKPVDRAQLLAGIKRGLSKESGGRDDAHTEPNDTGNAADAIIGESRVVKALRRRIVEYGATDITVLVTGESGTGKELVARALHDARNPGQPFVALNCGAIPQELVASELFGHEKGSFTGANALHRGAFERAGSGTVFLDEIGELPLPQQVVLLRVLETKKVQRIGAEREIEVSSRVIAATNQDLAQAVGEGKFREDLFFRINVLNITVPPLRERAGDVALLARHFLSQFAGEYGTPEEISAECLARLEAYQWPGNVRELKHTILRTAMLNRGETVVSTVPDDFEKPPVWSNHADDLAPGTSIRDVERRLIEKTLDHFGGNKKLTADALGVSLKTLYNRLRDYGRSSAED